MSDLYFSKNGHRNTFSPICFSRNLSLSIKRYYNLFLSLWHWGDLWLLWPIECTDIMLAMWLLRVGHKDSVSLAVSYWGVCSGKTSHHAVRKSKLVYKERPNRSMWKGSAPPSQHPPLDFWVNESSDNFSTQPLSLPTEMTNIKQVSYPLCVLFDFLTHKIHKHNNWLFYNIKLWGFPSPQS